MTRKNRLVSTAGTLAMALFFSMTSITSAHATNQLATACNFDPMTSLSIPRDGSIDIVMNVTPAPTITDDVFFYVEGLFNGVSDGEFDYRDYAYASNPYTLRYGFSYRAEREGLQYTINIYAVSSAGVSYTRGAQLCTLTLTYGGSTTKNYGKSDKTSDPNRDRKNFSPTPKK